MNQFLRRCFAAVLCAVLAAGVSFPISAEIGLNLASEAAVLIDADSGQILYEKNSAQQMYPASITKVMTGLLALKNLDPTVGLTVSASAVRAVPVTSSHVSLLPGEELTLEQAMYALAMESANDAANVLGEAVSGTLEAFAQRMTDEAAALGAVNTRFANANGLPDSQHYTTAYDMALITAEALKVPGFTEYFCTEKYVLPATNLSAARNFSNKNQFISGQHPCEGVIMSKTGWTSSALGTLVTAVRRGDTTLIAVVMKSAMLEDKYADTELLMDYGFSHYTRCALDEAALARQLELGEYVPIPGQQFSILLPTGTAPETLTFTLSQQTDLSADAPDLVTAEVTVNAGETLLQTAHIFLERPQPGRALEAEAVLAAAAPITAFYGRKSTAAGQQQSSLPWDTILIWGGGILIFIAAVVEIDHRKQRRNRRRKLEGRIRQMKRQLEE